MIYFCRAYKLTNDKALISIVPAFLIVVVSKDLWLDAAS